MCAPNYPIHCEESGVFIPHTCQPALQGYLQGNVNFSGTTAHYAHRRIGFGQPEGRPPKKMEVLALVSEATVQGGLRDYGKNVTFGHIR